MEDTLVFVDNGFFKLVKDSFEKESGKKKKLLQTFRNICKKENLNMKHLFFYYSPPYQSEKPSSKENKLRKDYDLIKKMIGKKKFQMHRNTNITLIMIQGIQYHLYRSKPHQFQHQKKRYRKSKLFLQ